jgi:hypothetical protein
MQLRMTFSALIIVAMLPGCGARTSATSGSLPSLTAENTRAHSASDPPFAYVAEICRTTSSCSFPNGLVQTLGGASITTGITNPTTMAIDGSGNLYVGNSTSANEGDVTAYAPNGTAPLRTLTGVVGVPKGLVADATGRLFLVAQYRSGCCELVGTGGIYAPGGTKPQKALKGLSGFAHSPQLDQSGNLYVANFAVFPGWVSVYAPGKHRPSRVISNGIGLPIGLAVAPNGALVVLNGLFSGGYNVVVYPAGEATPSLTITAGLQRSTAVAVDADGNIYVANDREKKRPGSVTVYRSGKTTVWRSIRSGISFPGALAFDGAGRLYVANVPDKKASTLVVFAAGGSKPIDTYQLTEQFSALAVPH